MERITVLAIDLAKNVFQLHGNNAHGKALLKKKLKRAELKAFMQQLPACVVAMEACQGAHYWAREFIAMGHDVRLISPQFVKPFVKSNKNDAADAEAIAEAAMRPNMRFVPVKQAWQQDILALHRVRERLVRSRTALRNEIRGLLAEYGYVSAQGLSSLKKLLAQVLAESEQKLSGQMRGLIMNLMEELQSLQDRVAECDRQMEEIHKNNEACQRVAAIEGVGPITATAIVAAMGDPKVFKNGRQFSAWLGLVPKQSSSGGKEVLLGISKRGDRYLRKLLIHGARSAIQYAHLRETQRSRWALEKVKTRGKNRATVAFANHNARIIWALLAKGEAYQAR